LVQINANLENLRNIGQLNGLRIRIARWRPARRCPTGSDSAELRRSAQRLGEPFSGGEGNGVALKTA